LYEIEPKEQKTKKGTKAQLPEVVFAPVSASGRL